MAEETQAETPEPVEETQEASDPTPVAPEAEAVAPKPKKPRSKGKCDNHPKLEAVVVTDRGGRLARKQKFCTKCAARLPEGY